jgi:hypothetical protein
MKRDFYFLKIYKIKFKLFQFSTFHCINCKYRSDFPMISWLMFSRSILCLNMLNILRIFFVRSFCSNANIELSQLSCCGSLDILQHTMHDNQV